MVWDRSNDVIVKFLVSRNDGFFYLKFKQDIGLEFKFCSLLSKPSAGVVSPTLFSERGLADYVGSFRRFSE